MKEKIVPSEWLEKDGRRLDCGPYLSGAIEAKVLLEKLPVPKEKMGELTAGHDGGIYNGPHFERNYVFDPQHGVPFLGSSSMLYADLSRVDLLRNRDAHSARLRHLRIEPGMTLISCSGTIGRTVYVRPDMSGYWTSQHIMKIVPDPSKILPGYLYAFLASKYGVPLVVGGTYGAIIQHIEPAHIWGLPVPRLDDALSLAVHKKVEEAAKHRSDSQSLRLKAKKLVERQLRWEAGELGFDAGPVSASLLQRRIDAFHHSKSVRLARQALAEHDEAIELRSCLDDVIEPNRGARRKVEDPAYGVPFLSSSEVFSLTPTADYLISKKTADITSFIITERDVLIPRSGQVGGLIGRAILPVSQIVGMAGSEHLIRLRCRDKEDAAYLWAILASQPGYFAVVGTAFGSSIPSIDRGLVADLHIPWITGAVRAEIMETVIHAQNLLAKAITSERAAITAVEETIDGLGT